MAGKGVIISWLSICKWPSLKVTVMEWSSSSLPDEDEDEDDDEECDAKENGDEKAVEEEDCDDVGTVASRRERRWWRCNSMRRRDR